MRNRTWHAVGTVGVMMACSCSGASATVASGAEGGPGGSGGGADGSTESGAPPDAGAAGTGGGYVVLASLDAPCDGQASLTGRAVVSQLVASYKATYTPRSASTGTPLTILVTYDSGEVRCHPAEHSTGGAPDRAAYVEVVVTMHFTTDDGAFKETLTDATVGNLGGALALQSQMPVSSVKGTFKPIDMPGFDLLSIGIDGNLLASGATNGGVQQYGAKSQPPPPGSVNPGSVAPAGSWK